MDIIRKTYNFAKKEMESLYNRKLLLCSVLPILNLLYMHYFFYISGWLEWIWLYSYVINLCSVVFDVFSLFILFLFVSKGRLKTAMVLTQTTTVLWSFVNVMYGRFFYQYLSLSTVAEIQGLQDAFVLNSIMSSFRWCDLYYVFSFICFVLLSNKIESHLISIKETCGLLVIPFCSLLLSLFAYSCYHFIHPQYRNNGELFVLRYKELLFDVVRGGTPNLAHFQTGCIRFAIFETYDMLKTTKLSTEQCKEITDFYKARAYRTTHHSRNPKTNNVIFILLESFLSSPVDLIVEGKEVTPFLNKLKKESEVFYNGNMLSDISCGESGDGQFIYMNGILPLRNKVTVGQIKRNTLAALPNTLRKEMGIKHAEIFYPTMPNLWQQADMNIVYGFTDAYSMFDIAGHRHSQINDKDIFTFASNKLNVSKEPFFSLLLSVSTHSPYNKFWGDKIVKTKNYPEEYCNYLNTCHYLDKQLNNYFNSLKQLGLYDSSLIIIAADHPAHLNWLKMDGKLSQHIPLFIINGDIDTNKAWKGEFHQLDVYTTILDILAVDNSWKGLGHTILSPNYHNSVDDEAYRISELIIEGDYFAQDNF